MLMDHPNWLKQRAELTPDRMAVIQGDHKLTFIQLFHEAKKRPAG
ncbi:O-succinylbenzoic acid--CoA ligase [Bacillus licheniformis]|nr:O-succinylbenzoic acid--CoA ligase [Bacillus licheniformis]